MYVEIKVRQAQLHFPALSNDSKDEYRKKKNKNEIMENSSVHQGIK